MRKTFLIKIEGKHPDRLLDAAKHEIRQYLKRERRKALPGGADYWDFDCRFGENPECAESVHVAQLTALIDGAAQGSAASFYLELIAKPALRTQRSTTKGET
ncbi:MAG: hypothetical protein KBD82_06900 [Rhodoferax sp.]|uniref:DUF6172 family protein n=1 Tax=Rhodoferax sp. TaxID=50421 RepID=UPI001B4B5EC7|nr:DUF6172 family protein [Rhodoferax sp.]MBP9735346.1 hypothetical protein [Rhodoferax sp.]